VAQNLESTSTREREVRALVEAMRALRHTQALILGDSNALAIEEDGLSVEIRSLAEWLLGGD